MILGRDFLGEIKLDILFSEDVLRWNDMDIRMKPSEECAKEASAIAYSEVFASNYGRRYEYEGEDDPLEGEILRLKDLADARTTRIRENKKHTYKRGHTLPGSLLVTGVGCAL
jgi:hypothetical protein